MKYPLIPIRKFTLFAIFALSLYAFQEATAENSAPADRQSYKIYVDNGVMRRSDTKEGRLHRAPHTPRQTAPAHVAYRACPLPLVSCPRDTAWRNAPLRRGARLCRADSPLAQGARHRRGNRRYLARIIASKTCNLSPRLQVSFQIFV